MQIDLPATPKPGGGGFVNRIDNLLTCKHGKNLTADYTNPKRIRCTRRAGALREDGSMIFWLVSIGNPTADMSRR